MSGHDFAAMRAALKSGSAVQVAVAPQLFPTPPHVAAQLVEALHLDDWAGEHWETLRVLEPSAGTGNLIEAVKRSEYGADNAIDLHAWEINHALAEQLRAKYPPQHGVRVLADDFLSAPVPSQLFDAIAMNPPYERGIWFAHVAHAWKFLKPGGRLAAVLPQSPQLDKLLQLVPLYARQNLPDNTFAHTGVRTCLVTMDKPE